MSKRSEAARREAARFVLPESRGYTAWLQEPGWPLEVEICLKWRIYSAESARELDTEAKEMPEAIDD